MWLTDRQKKPFMIRDGCVDWGVLRTFSPSIFARTWVWRCTHGVVAIATLWERIPNTNSLIMKMRQIKVDGGADWIVTRPGIKGHVKFCSILSVCYISWVSPTPNLLFDRALPPVCVTVDTHTLELVRAISMGLLSILVTVGGNVKSPHNFLAPGNLLRKINT